MFFEEMNQASAQKRISIGNAADIFNRTTDERCVHEWQNRAAKLMSPMGKETCRRTKTLVQARRAEMWVRKMDTGRNTAACYRSSGAQ
jgi:hypothetical protein